jgi:hypothetical protein
MGGKDRRQKISEVLLQFRTLGYLAACALIGLAAWHLWSRSVRSAIVIEAGPKGGFFEEAAILLKNELRRYHIGSVIVNRNETLKIIEDVNDSKSPVQVGFMAQDIGNRKYPNVTAIGTIGLEPLWIFYSASRDFKNVQDLKGMRLVVDPPGAGGRAMSERILGEYEINSQNTTFLSTLVSKSHEAIRMGSGDAALFLAPPTNKIAREMALDPNLRILSLSQAHALASNLGFLRAVTLPEGGFDYLRNVPSKNIELVAIPVTMIVKKNLRAADVTIIAQFIKSQFQAATLVSQPGELVNIHDPAVAVNVHAESVLQNGLPYTYRALPFSVAALLDQASLYLGFLLVAYSFYRFFEFPGPKLIREEIQLQWYVRKLKKLHHRIALTNNIAAQDRALIEKVDTLLNKEEVKMRTISKMLADIKEKMS